MSLPSILTQNYPRSKQPPRPLPDLIPFQDDSNWKLIVTTTSNVSAWDRDGCRVIFTSASQGIVAAKRAKDGSVLAIADAQVVMLHRIEDGQDKSYRLKGTQRCRLLQYDHDSSNLLYTDALHNSVQSYSLKEKRVGDASKPHPSAVTAFTVSCDSNLVLSCSSDPPTIQVHNKLLATTVSVMPQASNTAVVTCAFHPSRKHIFVLAFRDGVLAAYDYTRLTGRNNTRKDTGLQTVQTTARAIHAFRHLHDPNVAGSAGITGVEFIPGHRSRAVTVGEDGRMFLVDFEMADTLGSWHMGAPVVSLSIRPVSDEYSDEGNGSVTRKRDLGGHLIAVGTVHGRCYVYDGNGNKISEKIIDVYGGSILDVEWVHGNISISAIEDEDSQKAGVLSQSPEAENLEPKKRRGGRVRTSIKTSHSETIYLQGNNPIATPSARLNPPLEADEDEADDESRSAMAGKADPIAPSTGETGYMKLFSPVKKKRTTKAASLHGEGTKTKKSDPANSKNELNDYRSAISAPQLWNDSKENMQTQQKQDGFSMFQDEHSPIHERVTTESTTDAPLIRAVSSVPSEAFKVTDTTTDGQLLNEIRSIRAKVSGRANAGSNGNLALFAPYMPTRVRSTPARGLKPGIASSLIKRSASVPTKGTTAPEQANEGAVENSNHQRNEQIDDPSIEQALVAEQLAEQTTGDKQKDDTQESVTTEPDDIWVLASKPEKSRKRKKASQEEPGTATTSTSIDIDSSQSTIRSSKSRKTVSFSDEAPGETNSTQPASSDPAAIGEVWSTKASRASSMTLPPRNAVSNGTNSTEESSLDNRKLGTSISTNSSDDKLFYTPLDENGQSLSVTNVRLGQGLDPALREALLQMQSSMQTAMRKEMGKMQQEMHKQFQVQKTELQGLRTEMGKVREENEKLRSQLFALSGVRESVRKASGS